jgi:hypothetical protein
MTGDALRTIPPPYVLSSFGSMIILHVMEKAGDWGVFAELHERFDAYAITKQRSPARFSSTG